MRGPSRSRVAVRFGPNVPVCVVCLCFSVWVGPAAAPRRGGGAGFRFCCTRGAGQGTAGVWLGDGGLDRPATPPRAGCVLASSTAKAYSGCVCVCSLCVVCVEGCQPCVYHTGPYRGARYRPLVGGAHVERIQSPCVGSMSMQRGEHRALGWPPPQHTVGRCPAREWWQVQETLAIPVCGLASGVPLLNCGGNSGNHPAECGDCYRWGLVPAFMNQA